MELLQQSAIVRGCADLSSNNIFATIFCVATPCDLNKTLLIEKSFVCKTCSRRMYFRCSARSAIYFAPAAVPKISSKAAALRRFRASPIRRTME
jgi:hypothetical protein